MATPSTATTAEEEEEREAARENPPPPPPLPPAAAAVPATEQPQQLPPSWRLAPSQREDIFREIIFPQEIAPHLPAPSSEPLLLSPVSHHLQKQHSRRRPLAVLILGQTGAGKTRLAPLVSSALAANFSRRLGSEEKKPKEYKPVHLIADTYKTYHPFYSQCLASYPPAQASVLAGPDARVWLEMACQSAAEHRLDCVVESACRHPQDFSSLATIFWEKGYSVRVAILAVPEGLSRLGCLVRYYKRLPEAGSRGLPVRLTPKRVHDESYRGCEEGAGWVDQGKEVERVVVVRRNGGVAYEGRRDGDGGWKGKGGAKEALQRERRRGLSEDERRGVEGDLVFLRGLMRDGEGEGKLEGEVEEVEKLVKGLGGGSGGGEDGEGWAELEVLDADRFVGEGLDEGGVS
ncbi:zeta toxin-domain-containing protein [Podospora australis]|uniref:Zeta toxin-domain-containing protein n=1 Tax=Podospora australis TaxID=1536484 RepID=A0AAN6X412_9PEZI|nr:zeta toxin-domain-containing protein [Podospora australis]